MMESVKGEAMEGIELPNQKRIRTLGKKKNYKYFGIMVANTNRKIDIKEK